MSAAVTRPTQANPDMRQAGAVLGTLVLAAALVVAVAVVRQNDTRPDTMPAAVPGQALHDHGWSSAGAGSGSAQQAHDHGWSSASSPAGTLTVRGSKGGGLTYTGIPYPAPGRDGMLVIRGSKGGGLTYIGIPYPAPAAETVGGSHGTRLAQ